MKTSNAMQLKARIKARAQEANVSPQLVMQDYMLERISLSQWREKMVVKGGMLIASLIGVDSRVTKDLDATIRGFTLTHESAEAAFREIISIEVDDGIDFEFVRTEDIRNEDVEAYNYITDDELSDEEIKQICHYVYDGDPSAGLPF